MACECARMNWIGIDQTLEHHPACPIIKQPLDTQKLIAETTTLIGDILATDTRTPRSMAAAAKLVTFLSDDFSDRNDEAALLVKDMIRRITEKVSPASRDRFNDLIDVALARVDLRASLEYWMRQDDGKPLMNEDGNPGLTKIQQFFLDFMRYAHEEVLMPIIFAPMGSGKSSILVGVMAHKIGQNPNSLLQLICSDDDTAEKRGMAIKNILESPHYRKIYPNVIPDMNKWSNHELLVVRSQADSRREPTKLTMGDSGAIDNTLVCKGVGSGGLGSRAGFSGFDDLATYENAIRTPRDGVHVSNILAQKWFTRKKSPIGVSNLTYDYKQNPWRGIVIGTPWSHDDCIYSLRDWDGAAVALIGVNEAITAYNVEIWSLPNKYIELLRRKYGQGSMNYGPVPDIPEQDETYSLREWCVKRNLPIAETYDLGPGISVDKLNPAKAFMEIPLSRPRQWYLRELKQAKDERRDFDIPRRCRVYSEGEKAFPNFANSLLLKYPDDLVVHPLTHATEADRGRTIQVRKTPILSKRDGAIVSSGWLAEMIDPPLDYSLKIAMVDLSGANRAGTVLSTAVLTSNYRRRIVEVAIGAWAAEDISDQVGKLFTRHPDLSLCYIETVSMQDLFVKEMVKHKTTYPWWPKIACFDKTTTSKHDEQIGILTTGVSYANGGFEIPNTFEMEDHGRLCPCGYCIGIKDAITQIRTVPITSDVLITWWGLHIQMPHSFVPPEPEAPTGYKHVASGAELMKAHESSAITRAIFAGSRVDGQKTTSLFNPQRTLDKGWK